MPVTAPRDDPGTLDYRALFDALPGAYLIHAQNSAGAGMIYVGRFGGACECNATLPECLQPGLSRCLPVYFTASSVIADGNGGTCPRGTAALPPGGDGQICIGATNCTGRDYNTPACS